MAAEDRTTPVERIVGRDLDRRVGLGRPLSRRARQSQRSLEAYLEAGVRPRWMERVSQIDAEVAREKRRIEGAYRELQERCGGEPALFARSWRARARAFRFDELNELIAQHNEWFPIERDLPLDPRTRDYVPIQGRSYRRPVLGAGWVLQHFPPILPPAPPGAQLPKAAATSSEEEDEDSEAGTASPIPPSSSP
jgi:hypothetical protein